MFAYPKEKEIMLKHITEIRVRYGDTDQMKFAYHGRYLDYFEIGRSEMMRDNDLPYKVIEDNGYHMPVVETMIKFKNPAFYDEVLLIESRVEKLPLVKVRIDHTIKSKERDVVICEGYIELAFVDAKTGKPIRPPKIFQSVVQKYFE